MTTKLPSEPITERRWAKCGICEGVKIDKNGIWWCEHCDEPCRQGGMCPECRAGHKGLE